MAYRKMLDKKVLESLKNKIHMYLKNHGLASADFMKANMDEVAGLYVEDSTDNKGPRMQSRGARADKPSEIMIDKQFAEFDNNGNPVDINRKIRKLVLSQLGHELLHSAARYDGRTGIMEGGENRGLNEGYTQMITEKIFGYVVSPNTDGYRDFKKFAKILDITFGEDVTLRSYFDHTDDLKNACNETANDPNFYKSLNTATTTMYQLKQKGKDKDEYYTSLAQPLYDKLREAIYQKICISTVIPTLKTLSKQEQSAYIKEIMESLQDDPEAMREFGRTIEEFSKLDDAKLQAKTQIIEKSIQNLERKYDMLQQMYQEKDYAKLFTVENDGRIYTVSEPKIEIKAAMMKEKILAQMYFAEKGFLQDPAKKQAFEDRVQKKMETLDSDSAFKFSDSIVNNPLAKMKLFAAMKYTAREKGFIVFNGLEEASQSKKSVDLQAMPNPKKTHAVTFKDLRSIYEKYTIDYESNQNHKNKMIIKDRGTGAKINDSSIITMAKFANFWAFAAGIKWMPGEKINGITYAFNEESEKVFNKLSAMISQGMLENGQMDTKTIFDTISQHPYKYAPQIVADLFKTPEAFFAIHSFYKLQNPEAKLETQFPKTSYEFLRGLTGDDFASVEASAVAASIPSSVGVKKTRLNLQDIRRATKGVGYKEVIGVSNQTSQLQTQKTNPKDPVSRN